MLLKTDFKYEVHSQCLWFIIEHFSKVLSYLYLYIGTKEPARIGDNDEKNRTGQSVKGERSGEKEERTSNKYQADNRERVRNRVGFTLHVT